MASCRIEVDGLLVERLRLVERRGVLVERARAHVEVVRRAGARTGGVGAEDAHDVAAEALDAEVHDHLAADGLERAVLGLHDDATTVAHDAELLERTGDARERATERADGGRDVLHADVAREEVVRRAERDQILERVRLATVAHRARRDDLRLLEAAQLRRRQAEELRDLARREDVGDGLARALACRTRTQSRRPRDAPSASRDQRFGASACWMRPPPGPKATWMTSPPRFFLPRVRRGGGGVRGGVFDELGMCGRIDQSRHGPGALDPPSLYQRRLHVDVNPQPAWIFREGRTSHTVRPSMAGARLCASRCAQRSACTCTCTSFCASARRNARSSTGVSTGSPKIRLVVPYQTRSPLSSLTPPSLIASASWKRSRQRPSVVRTKGPERSTRSGIRAFLILGPRRGLTTRS